MTFQIVKNHIFGALLFACLPLQMSLAQSAVIQADELKKATREERKPHLGLRAGMTNPQKDYDGAFAYGLEVGYQPYIPYSATFEFSAYSSEGSDANLARMKLLAKMAYNFGGTTPLIRYSYVGAGIGGVMDRISGVSRGRLGVDLNTGFDIPLDRLDRSSNQTVSLGANANYLFVNRGAPDDFGLTGVMKVWY